MDYLGAGIVTIIVVLSIVELRNYIWSKTWEIFERGYKEGYKAGQENKK